MLQSEHAAQVFFIKHEVIASKDPGHKLSLPESYVQMSECASQLENLKSVGLSTLLPSGALGSFLVFLSYAVGPGKGLAGKELEDHLPTTQHMASPPLGGRT